MFLKLKSNTQTIQNKKMRNTEKSSNYSAGFAIFSCFRRLDYAGAIKVYRDGQMTILNFVCCGGRKQDCR